MRRPAGGSVTRGRVPSVSVSVMSIQWEVWDLGQAGGRAPPWLSHELTIVSIRANPATRVSSTALPLTAEPSDGRPMTPLWV
jgi:hypothetical protein